MNTLTKQILSQLGARHLTLIGKGIVRMDMFSNVMTIGINSLVGEVASRLHNKEYHHLISGKMLTITILTMISLIGVTQGPLLAQIDPRSVKPDSAGGKKLSSGSFTYKGPNVGFTGSKTETSYLLQMPSIEPTELKDYMLCSPVHQRDGVKLQECYWWDPLALEAPTRTNLLVGR